MAHGQFHRRQTAERHADDDPGVGREVGHDDCDVVGEVDRCVGAVVTPVGVAVTGQVDCECGPPECQCNGVPRVRVLRAAVDEHDLRLVRTPAQGTHVTSRVVRHRHVDAFNGWDLPDVQLELGDVLPEQREFVVVDQVCGSAIAGSYEPAPSLDAPTPRSACERGRRNRAIRASRSKSAQMPSLRSIRCQAPKVAQIRQSVAQSGPWFQRRQFGGPGVVGSGPVQL